MATSTEIVCGPSTSAVGTVHGLVQSTATCVSTRQRWISAPPTRVNATVGRGPDGLDGYDVNVTLARFLLLVAFHDSVEGQAGVLVVGKENSHATLSLDAWTGNRYATVEHIAPQSKPKGWAADLYDDEQFERLGNLTLLPLNANQSLSDRPWNHKRQLFGALAASTAAEAAAVVEAMKQGGVDVSKVAGGIHCGHYLPHVRVLSTVAGEWDRAAVDKRGRELASRCAAAAPSVRTDRSLRRDPLPNP